MLRGIRPGATAGYAGTIACLLFLGSAANLKADTILGNLPVTNDSTPTLIGGQFVKAIGFTLSPGQNYNLTQLTLRLAGFSVGRVPVVTLRENVGGADPGANVLVQFSNPPAQGNDYFNYAFTPASPFTLLANTKYWLVVSESAGTIAWSASIPSVTPSGVAVLNNNRLSTDGGVSYGDSARFNNFQLEGTPVVNPVPEASSALFLLGAVAVAARLRFVKTDKPRGVRRWPKPDTTMRPLPCLTACLVLTAAVAPADDLHWPQFRGPSGRGVGLDAADLPASFGPGKAMLWKTDLPAGHGSPCVARDRVFVTAFTAGSKTLETIALNRSSGAIVWRHTIPATRIETVHPTSSPATSTPVTDGKRVFVYSGSYGVIAYEWDGSVAWTYPMEVAKSPSGSGTSPVLAGDFVVFTRDYMPTPSLFALRKTDGSLAWKTTLAQSTLDGAKAAHSTPLIWNNQIVLCRPGTLSAYKIEDGSPLWWFPQASPGTSTPTFGADILYWNAPGLGGDLFTVPKPPPFTEALAKYDANGDGKLARTELPEKDLYFVRRAGVSEDTPGAHVTLRTAWVYFDENKDNFLDAREYQGFMEAGNNIPPAAAGVLALRPGTTATGVLPADALVWQEKRNAPEVSTALEYRGRVYSVSSGGIISCLDAKTGKVVYRGRVNAPGNYWASPVAAGGKIFLASADGVVTVLGGGDRLEVLANNDLGDPIQGTPALAGSTIYIRSNNALWAFGKP